MSTDVIVDRVMGAALQQHCSHRALLARPDLDEVRPAVLDAVIVPTARPADSMRAAIAVGKALDVPLLLLCSKQSSVTDAIVVAKQAGVQAVAIDSGLVGKGRVPQFATDTLLSGGLFRRCADTSFKRNLGLLIAALAGWHRVGFLDDDITLPDPPDLQVAAGLLETHSVVGLEIDGMADNSVVCHAFRESGGWQDTFIGGGAMVVAADAFRSFFPSIYNEDWFFLLDSARLRPSALTGKAMQASYDPYADARRAREQELGDTLAEGIFALLDDGCGLSDATAAYWAGFLGHRRQFIDITIARAGAADICPMRRARMVEALKAAKERNLLIKPELCVDYLRAWRDDLTRWNTHMDVQLGGNRDRQGLDRAFRTLGIGDLVHRT